MDALSRTHIPLDNLDFENLKSKCVLNYKMKDNIRAELKLSGFHRDLIRLLRSLYPEEQL